MGLLKAVFWDKADEASLDQAGNDGFSAGGQEKVRRDVVPVIASEDLAHKLRVVPDSYMFRGNGASGYRDGKPVGVVSPHNPSDDFNDAILGTTAEFWAALTADYLRPERHKQLDALHGAPPCNNGELQAERST